MLFAVLFAVTGCGGAGGRGASGNGSNDTTQTVTGQTQTGVGQLGYGTGQPEAAISFPARHPSHGERLQLPSIPATLNAPEQQAEYLVMHYWDNYDFADTTLMRNADYTEQAFVDFIYLLPNAPQRVVRGAMETLLRRAATTPAMFDHFTELAESYLYDPNSPMRNEDLYIPVLETIIALPSVDSLLKIRPRHQLTTALKNRPGMQAADFSYTTERTEGGTASRRTARLSDIKADYTLLFFYDPDCPDCKRIKQFIASSEVFVYLTGGVGNKWLTVLALYPDKGQLLRNKELYDLRAIPTLYLLDSNKRVLLKDAPVERIEQYLSEVL